MKLHNSLRWMTHFERRRFYRIAMVMGPAVAAVLILMTEIFDFFPYSEGYVYRLTALGLLAASGAVALMMYLQTGFSRGPRSIEVTRAAHPEWPRIDAIMDRQQQETRRLLDEVEKRLRAEIAELANVEHGPRVLTDSERASLVDATAKAIHRDAAEAVISTVQDEVSTKNRNDAIAEAGSILLDDTRTRLQHELSALSRRGNLNLVIGILTTIVGLSLMGWFVLQFPENGATATDRVASFLPRLSLIAFIEVFAYFFLRLYKASLAEIKYFQNELTNVESKAVALRISLLAPHDDSLAAVATGLATTERN